MTRAKIIHALSSRDLEGYRPVGWGGGRAAQTATDARAPRSCRRPVPIRPVSPAKQQTRCLIGDDKPDTVAVAALPALCRGAPAPGQTPMRAKLSARPDAAARGYWPRGAEFPAAPRRSGGTTANSDTPTWRAAVMAQTPARSISSCRRLRTAILWRRRCARCPQSPGHVVRCPRSLWRGRPARCD